MSFKQCRYLAASEQCPWGCQLGLRVCHDWARGQRCERGMTGCSYQHGIPPWREDTRAQKKTVAASSQDNAERGQWSARIEQASRFYNIRDPTLCDQAMVEALYREMQKVVHPDRHHAATSSEKQRLNELSDMANKCRKELLAFVPAKRSWVEQCRVCTSQTLGADGSNVKNAASSSRS